VIPLNEFTETLIGEEPHAGEQCVLIRIAGCNLDCRWCDTPDREKIIERVETDELADRAVKTGRPWALVTGGEPMNCDETPELLGALLSREICVLMETNGSFSLEKVPPEVVKSVDIKTPSSGFAGRFMESNLEFLDRKDVAKFVIADRNDFDWALNEIERLDLFSKSGVIFSPVWEIMEPKVLVRMILDCGLPVRLSVQLHKILRIK